GGGGGDAGGSEAGPSGDDLWATCEASPRAELGAPEGSLICADSGLEPTSDQFAFANWGGPTTSDTFTPDVAVAIFGSDAVCMDLTNGCVVYPAAQQWMDQMNAAIQGGRCEGMATLSQRLLDGRDPASSLQGGANATIDLMKEELPVGGSIAKWWASQTFSEVRKPTQKTLDLDPVEIAERIINALNDGAGPTLGLYGDGVAHAVTPVAVTTDGANSILVHVYDNNFPGMITAVKIDRATKTWMYDTAATNADVGSSVWSGGQGTLDLTLMADREIKPEPTWDESDSTKGVTRVVMTTGGVSAAGVIVTAGEITLDSRDLTQRVDGINVYPFRGAYFGTGAMVEISSKLGRFTVQPVLGNLLDPGATKIPFTFGVDAPGAAAFQVSGEAESAEDELPTATVEADDTGYNFELEGDGEFEIDVALGEEGYEFDVDGEVGLEFNDDEEEDAALTLTDGEGEELWTDELDGVDDDGEFGATEVSYDEESGEVSEEDVAYEAYDLDEELLASLEDDFPTAEEVANDEGDDSGSDSTDATNDESGSGDVSGDDVTDDTSSDTDSTNESPDDTSDSSEEESTTTQPEEEVVETDPPAETDAPADTDPPAEE
ncbi:MAG: hypothetical protein RL391_1549, partial [Actinomycetota bacterium]